MANVHAAERKVNVIFNTFHHAQNMRREIRALCLRRFTYKFKDDLKFVLALLLQYLFVLYV